MRAWIKSEAYKYVEYLVSQRSYTKATEKTYNINLTEAIRYIDIEKQDKTIMIDMLPYRLHIKDKAKKTIYKKVSIFKSFITYLQQKGNMIKLLHDENISTEKTLPKPIKSSFINEALQKASLDEKLMINLLYGVGLRISELSNLKLESIKNSWVVIKGKGGKIRQIPIIQGVETLLQEYLKAYHVKEYLFEKDGKKLSDGQLRYKITKVFKDIGLKVTPHQLRHSFATELLQNGASISDVSSLLGHSSLETTQIYTKLSTNLKMNNYKKAHPLSTEGEGN